MCGFKRGDKRDHTSPCANYGKQGHFKRCTWYDTTTSTLPPYLPITTLGLMLIDVIIF
jgi:hypothetical protein